MDVLMSIISSGQQQPWSPGVMGKWGLLVRHSAGADRCEVERERLGRANKSRIRRVSRSRVGFHARARSSDVQTCFTDTMK
jgi:hypothetical protein